MLGTRQMGAFTGSAEGGHTNSTRLKDMQQKSEDKIFYPKINAFSEKSMTLKGRGVGGRVL